MAKLPDLPVFFHLKWEILEEDYHTTPDNYPSITLRIYSNNDEAILTMFSPENGWKHIKTLLMRWSDNPNKPKSKDEAIERLMRYADRLYQSPPEADSYLCSIEEGL